VSAEAIVALLFILVLIGVNRNAGVENEDEFDRLSRERVIITGTVGDGTTSSSIPHIPLVHLNHGGTIVCH
jgi:hypothetical protein